MSLIQEVIDGNRTVFADIFMDKKLTVELNAVMNKLCPGSAGQDISVKERFFRYDKESNSWQCSINKKDLPYIRLGDLKKELEAKK